MCKAYCKRVEFIPDVVSHTEKETGQAVVKGGRRKKRKDRWQEDMLGTGGEYAR